MTHLASLKLVTAQRNTATSPVAQRRNKLLKAIFEQIELASAMESGQPYAPTKQKKSKDAETGEQAMLTVPKRVKCWWWTGDNGKLQMNVRYGSRVLTLNNKGANAIECADGDVIKLLETITKAVHDGEFDAALENASKAAKDKVA